MTTKTRTNKRDRMYQQMERHWQNLLAIFPNATERDPVKLCKKLRRLELKAAAIGLQLCNGPEVPPDEQEASVAYVLGRVDYVLQFRNLNIPVFVNLDPRGYALKIDDEWMNAQRADHRTAYKAALHRDMGGYGILAPEFDGN